MSESWIDGAAVPFWEMPVGGIGTGNFAVGSDGGLRQWQLHNQGNHRGDLPHTFFAVRASCVEPPLDVTRVLQARREDPPPTPCVTDGERPAWQRSLVDELGVERCEVTATYPELELRFRDPALPVDVDLQVLNPMIPADSETSGIPVGMFTFTLTSTSPLPIHGWLSGSLLNAVGWDGVTPFDGVDQPDLGGNTNRVLRSSEWTKLILENHSIPGDHPGAGQMLLATDSATAAAAPQWATPQQCLRFLETQVWQETGGRLRGAPLWPDANLHAPAPATGPSATGSTWAGALAHRFSLQPGESVVIRYLLAWSFPNRFVNFRQFGVPRPEWGMSRFWLGNHYAHRYPNAEAVHDDVSSRWEALVEASRSWTSTLSKSSLPARSVQHLAAQAAYVRSPSCFRAADGAFYGFEGVLGASTRMWNADVGGSCPLNCTHVWNYEQALAWLFPDLERSMRETEFKVMQHSSGYLLHRVVVPPYLEQSWQGSLGGPEDPALDGMLGCVLKTLREVQLGAGRDWLATYWPHVCRLMDYVKQRWDPRDSHLLHGIQPSTHDIDLCGVNPYIGTLYLAALRAAEELARIMGDEERRNTWHDEFEASSEAYDRVLFNGDYYEQKLDDGDEPDFQWVTGCLADQVIGQWWAHSLGLGHILPADHVRSALRAVVRENLLDSFVGFSHGYRVFADQADAGLLTCTWPAGGRPAVPTRYADEVWTGIEYQVAAHCYHEGLTEEADRIVDAVWRRYDGRRRNPFNEIECGDHYVRAMSGWSLIAAQAGFHYDALSAKVRCRPGAPEGRWPFVHAHGWGWFVREQGQCRILDVSGTFQGTCAEV